MVIRETCPESNRRIRGGNQRPLCHECHEFALILLFSFVVIRETCPESNRRIRGENSSCQFVAGSYFTTRSCWSESAPKPVLSPALSAVEGAVEGACPEPCPERSRRGSRRACPEPCPERSRRGSRRACPEPCPERSRRACPERSRRGSRRACPERSRRIELQQLEILSQESDTRCRAQTRIQKDIRRTHLLVNRLEKEL